MEPLIDGIGSYSKTHSYASGVGYNPSTVSGAGRPSYPSSMKSCRFEGATTASCSAASDHGVKTAKFRMDAVANSEEAYKTNHDHMRKEPSDLSHHKSNKGDSDSAVDQTVEISTQMKLVSTSDQPEISYADNSMDSLLEAANLLLDQQAGGSGQVTSKEGYQPEMKYCPSPQNSFYSATQFTEAKQSFTCTEVSECASAEKSGESYEVTTSEDVVESRKTSICRGSTGSDVSDESSSSSLSSTVYKPHMANDTRWEAIKAIRSRDGALGFNHFRLLKRLGCGDIGSVYLSELSGTRSYFAMKVMDKAALASRKKLVRVQTEREILQSLDHPFLPTLYAHFETEKYSCLVMEFCPGGDLHALRQRQPGKYFPEHAVRFYVAEVLLALEYLHMLGIIYRDLKPENVLVRDDGHIMLSDFDLSLRCAVSPTLVRSSNSLESKTSGFCVQPSCVVQPACIQPACFTPRFFNKQPKKPKKVNKQKTEPYNQTTHLPELVAEPTSARSMSFVGTHEYLAPEIVKGEGHGSAVDWWTFGIFLYELLFGRTPFKGQGNRATLFNVVGQPLRFPEHPSVSFAARDLIRGLLVKEPQHRLAYRRGATEIKQHPFFQNVNWALIRCANPPDVPKPYLVELARIANNAQAANAAEKAAGAGVDVKPSGNYLEIDFF